MGVLKLIRWQNLLLFGGIMYVLRYGFFHNELAFLFLNDWQFGLLVVSMLSIVGAGYIELDRNDLVADQINRPGRVWIDQNVDEVVAFRIYMGLNIFGIGSAFYLNHLTENQDYTYVFLFVAATLYFYSGNLKNIPIVNHLIPSLMMPLLLIVPIILDVLPILNEFNKAHYASYFKVIIDMSILYFILTFAREILKDVGSIDGDCNTEEKTLPVLLGSKRALLVVQSLLFLVAALCGFYAYYYLWPNELWWSMRALIFLVIAPLLYIVFMLNSKPKKKELFWFARLLKYLLLVLILVASLMVYNITENVQ